jgi:hypothetical protein
MCLQTQAQELFVYTEPASNMAAKSIGIRLSNSLVKVTGTSTYNYHLIPEVMVGVSKNIMVHAEAFLSNRNNSLVTEGGALYFKYRFYSKDDVHSHFRMAAWARGSLNNSDIHQEAIDLNGHNSGVETGIIATQLINKVALSAGAGYLYAADNSQGNKFNFGEQNLNAVGYNFSMGKLMLPKEYTSYDQVNMNLMTEFLGQTNLHTGDTYLDLAPSVQFIFKSRIRLDVGYRLPLVKDLQRTAPAGALLRFEYNIFNAF